MEKSLFGMSLWVMSILARVFPFEPNWLLVAFKWLAEVHLMAELSFYKFIQNKKQKFKILQ